MCCAAGAGCWSSGFYGNSCFALCLGDRDRNAVSNPLPRPAKVDHSLRMKITVWGINYGPELTGIAPYNQALCEFLSHQGHLIRMVTGFPYYPAWEKNASDRRVLFRTERMGEVNVHRCCQFVPQRPRAMTRILHELSFVFLSFFRLLMLPRPDVFIVISPPLLLGAAAWLLTRLKPAPFVFHVQDLQPDAAYALGM